MTAPDLATERIWRTSNGMYVPDGHQDAAFLAAAEGDPVPDGFVGFDPEPRKPAKKAASKIEAVPASKPEVE